MRLLPLPLLPLPLLPLPLPLLLLLVVAAAVAAAGVAAAPGAAVSVFPFPDRAGLPLNLSHESFIALNFFFSRRIHPSKVGNFSETGLR